MSAPKKSKRKNNIAVSVKVDNNATESMQAMLSFLHHLATETNPIIQQSMQIQDIQNSLINKIDLLSPTFDKFLDDQFKAQDLQKVLSSPINEMIRSANLSLGNILESSYFSSTNKLIQEALVQSDAWKIRVDEIQDMFKATEPYSFAVQSHLAEIGKFSALSQSYLSGISYADIGNAINVPNTVSGLLKNSFTEFSDSYSGLFRWLDSDPLRMFSVSPILSKLPSIEFFNGVNTVSAITIDNANDVKFLEEKNQINNIVALETEERLDLLLARLNPDFLVPLSGARESLRSDNPDRTRHLSTSLRELFTQVLHTLAPDEKIRAWSNSPKDYSNKKPTRRARLLYVCEKINQGPFSVFVEKDVESALAFLDMFQQGTHEVITSYTDAQLKAMLTRMESLLRYLIEIANSD